MIAARIKHFLQHHFRREMSFVQARLSAEGVFGLHLTIGVVVVVGAAWLFGGISEDLISGDPLILVDELISEWFRSHATPRFATGMHFASALASTATVSILVALMGCVLLWKRLWYWLLGLMLVVAGGMLLNVMLKDLFGRARPGWADPLMELADPSFPSGHTMMATIIYGLTGPKNHVLAVAIFYSDLSDLARFPGRAKQDVSGGALLKRCIGGDGGRNSLGCALPYRGGNIASPPRPAVVRWQALS